MRSNFIKIRKENNFLYNDTNLFLITTAFQLVCAAEAMAYFKNTNNIIIFIKYGNVDKIQYKDIIELCNYNVFIEANFSQLKKKQLMKETITLLNTIHNIVPVYDKVFTGFYSANLRRIIANIKYSELYLIDDGVYTISIHHELFSKKTDNIKTKYIRKYSEKNKKTFFKKARFLMFHYFRCLYFYLHGYKNDIKNKKQLNFFTMFNLTQIQKEKIIIHNFEHLKSIYKNKTMIENVNENIFFLGQPLDRVLDISNERYLNHIKYYILNKGFENKHIFYVPHRAENAKIIQEIVNISKNITVLKLDEPFEIYCLKNNLTINHLVSFVSTALYSIKKLYPKTKIDAIKLSNDKQYSIDSKEIYEEFNKIGINIYEM